MSNGLPMARSGWVNRKQPPALADIQRFNPNRPDAVEAIFQPIYDYQTYAAAGQTQLNFFQVPVGQSSKTYADTNMTNAGMFPSPTAFFITGIMVDFNPANLVSDAGATSADLSNWIDAVEVAESGWLEFEIGAKVYLRDAPIGKFPPNFSVGGVAAIAGTFTAGLATWVDYAQAVGRYYEITPFLIPATQNFKVSLNWPAAVAVVTAGRIGVILDGFVFRNSQ